ncbi:MAG: hypothetical protein H7842_01235 [Gammaproteobacteria bacterium SHHR-1]|uniref:hypothetical protein n=1 Tax=Magnetovirga frankeli TaxID=947516 RepID=UPI0012932029|nr:hypothetical protein D5125_09155 [gamma proteobacterium SS-5]
MPLIPFMIVGGITVLLAPLLLILLGRPKGGKPRIEGIELDKDSDEDVIVTSEEIPLDNGQGSDVMSSEHEFSCCAGNELSLHRSHEIEMGLDHALFPLLEAGIAKSLRKGMGLEMNERITRSVKIRFNVAPGARNRYRIIWKQQRRRGSLVFKQDRQELRLPFEITYGLSHEVESLPGSA